MGAKSPKTSDRRIQRTRRSLREALVALLLERSWDEIRVQDICDRADVGRSTFYTHYADKEDLLFGGFDDLRAMLRRLPSPADARTPLSFARGLIEHAFEHAALFRALVGKRGGQVVIRRFRELIIDLVREDVAAVAPAGPSLEATIHFIAGGFFELLNWWLEADTELGPAELEQMFLEMAAPGLQRLRE